MRFSVWLASSLLFVLPALARAEQPGILEPLDECPVSEPGCIWMAADFKWYGKVHAEFLVQHPMAKNLDGNETFSGPVTLEFPVRGRLDGGPEKRWRLRIVSEQSRLYCEDHGFLAVAPKAILTKQGTFEITDDLFTLGDRGNLRLIDRKAEKATYRFAPDWDGAHWHQSMVVKPDGRILWKFEGRCLDLEAGRRFKAVSPAECETAPARLPVSPEDLAWLRKFGLLGKRFLRDSEGRILEAVPDSPYFISFSGIACT